MRPAKSQPRHHHQRQHDVVGHPSRLPKFRRLHKRPSNRPVRPCSNSRPYSRAFHNRHLPADSIRCPQHSPTLLYVKYFLLQSKTTTQPPSSPPLTVLRRTVVAPLLRLPAPTILARAKSFDQFARTD